MNANQGLTLQSNRSVLGECRLPERAHYELVILGAPSTHERKTLYDTLSTLLNEFHMIIGNTVILRDADTLVSRNRLAACAAVYFGGQVTSDISEVGTLLKDSIPVIPTISSRQDFRTDIPTLLQFANGLKRRDDDLNMHELANALLECVGLLRKQRRVFVSYRRIESRAAAVQLHDMLTERGFDVFLDTHSIRPGDPFQDVLWHRLCDSDVMVMLDTPSYFESRWTREEIGRARAKEIQILRVIWPGLKPNRLTDMAETVYLNNSELEGVDGPLNGDIADKIVLMVERLRSRSIASRYMSITGKLRAEIEKIGGRVESIGVHRAIAIRLMDGRLIWAYPIVGIPSAEILNDIANKARQANQPETPVLVYDHVGIQKLWSSHLDWLDEHIQVVRAIKVSEAGWRFAAWEGSV